MTERESGKVSKKIIERIQSLLAMGSDTSSEHEAQIAMRRARKLMDEHQVTLIDIDNIKHDDLGSSEYNLNSTRQKIWISNLVIAIAELNDCVVSFASRYSRKSPKIYLFQGFQEDVKLCEFMIFYLVDTSTRLYERDKVIFNLKGLADKNNYLLGVSVGLGRRMKEISNQRKEDLSKNVGSRSLTVAKLSVVKERFGTPKHKSSNYEIDHDPTAYNSGKLAAQSILLGNFVGNDATESLAVECVL